MRKQRPNMPYTELYFKVKVLREVGRILAGFAAVIFVGFYYILTLIVPNQADDVIGAIFFILIAGGALAILYMIVNGIYRIFIPAPPKLRPEWVPQGAIANPKGDWFDSEGRPLWVRRGDQWIAINREPSAPATHSESGSRNPRF
jgi:hypothetical protein